MRAIENKTFQKEIQQRPDRGTCRWIGKEAQCS